MNFSLFKRKRKNKFYKRYNSRPTHHSKHSSNRSFHLPSPSNTQITVNLSSQIPNVMTLLSKSFLLRTYLSCLPLPHSCTVSSSLLRSLKTVTPTTSRGTNDDYFAAIHHISNIVRRDIYLERTLNKMPIQITSELVYRVLRSCSNSGIESFRFFNWARTHPSYDPTTVEFEELVKTLAKTRHWETMWKVLQK